ncbi:conserved hypothetical protein [Desulfitobacterium hafniense DCB-2]|uniref:Uncharacterized protein n=1 Tax=Desulfitobacterium hafniense (strain DSM 10664 / DCB-2) TaxID=272564 RepID=B8FZ57_DESHD|nr:hypothetical protein [Desulfitobacterium hafniense]ACL22809.1 conserved hypothetical protein [Desulfitobacterium hafniense DCB-2]
MPEQSARLGIPLPLGNENVSRQAIREMLQAVDEHAETIPGAQAKADAAEAAAKSYADSAAGSAAGAVASALAAHKAESIYLQEEEPSAANHKTLWFAIGSEANFDGGGVNIANAQTSTTPPEIDGYWFEPIKS